MKWAQTCILMLSLIYAARTVTKSENVVPEVEILAPSNDPVLELSVLGMNLIVQY